MAPSILAEIVADHILACNDARRVHSVLQRALQSELAAGYAGGRTALLHDILQQLNGKWTAATDEPRRLWVAAVMLLVQDQIDSAGPYDETPCGIVPE